MATDALVVPLGDLLYPSGADRPEGDAEYPGHVLDGVVVGEDGAVHIQGESQHGHVDRGEPSQVAAAAGGLGDAIHGGLGAVRYADHVAPEGQAGVPMVLKLPDDARGAYMLLLRERV